MISCALGPTEDVIDIKIVNDVLEDVGQACAVLFVLVAVGGVFPTELAFFDSLVVISLIPISARLVLEVKP